MKTQKNEEKLERYKLNIGKNSKLKKRLKKILMVEKKWKGRILLLEKRKQNPEGQKKCSKKS